MTAKAYRATVELRNAELEVLKGGRHGKKYRKVGHKNRYTASAPGEAPAVRSGELRLNWKSEVKVKASGKMIYLSPALISGAKHAGYLEDGTSKMSPRPYKDKIIAKARPNIMKILKY